MPSSKPRALIRRSIDRITGVEGLAASIRDERDRLRLELERIAAERGADRAAAAELDRRLGELEAKARIAVVMEWARRAELDREPPISVLMPTRDRSEVLGRAIASVLAQSYPNLELIVVDDGSTDATTELLAAVEDPRLRAHRIDGVGVTAARNAGLGLAGGELIAYLDDDNLMHEHWLRTVAWAFEQRPRTEVAYGAFVLDDPESVGPGDGAGLPELVFRPFDREALAAQNPADMSAIAHRAELGGARFDEGLSMYGDWEFLARVTRDRDPLAIPAIACFYATDAPARLSAEPIDPREHRAVLDALDQR